MELNTGIITDKKLNIGQLYDKNNITELQQLVDGRGLSEFTQTHKIKTTTIVPNAEFGISISNNNNKIIVGADENGEGYVYIFNLIGQELFSIQASDKAFGDDFGCSVDCNDTRIVVGAMGGDAAYIFDFDGNEQHILVGSDTIAGDYFGGKIACNDTRIVVGAHYQDTGQTNAGAAYIFDFDGNQIAKVQATVPDGSGFFGNSIACNDTRIVVGSSWEDQTQYRHGAVYIFDLNGNLITRINGESTQVECKFGAAVAISNNRIVVGAPEENKDGGTGDEGAVYIFDLDGNFISKLLSSNVSTKFGVSVDISDTRIIVGEGDIFSSAGATYIYDINGNEINSVEAPVAVNKFGAAVNILNNNTVLIGSPEDEETESDSGAFYIFEQKLLPSTTSDIAGAQPNSVTYANVIDEVYKIV